MSTFNILQMNLRKATIDDWKLLLAWRNDESTRKNSISPEIISPQMHRIWLQNVLADKYRELYIAEKWDKPVGTVRADYDPETSVYELSWTTAPHYRRRSIGKTMVSLLLDKLGTKVIAQIKKGNIPSMKIAEYAGMHLKKEEDGIFHYTNY